jgi:hypothetical protein
MPPILHLVNPLAPCDLASHGNYVIADTALSSHRPGRCALGGARSSSRLHQGRTSADQTPAAAAGEPRVQAWPSPIGGRRECLGETSHHPRRPPSCRSPRTETVNQLVAPTDCRPAVAWSLPVSPEITLWPSWEPTAVDPLRLISIFRGLACSATGMVRVSTPSW